MKNKPGPARGPVPDYSGAGGAGGSLAVAIGGQTQTSAAALLGISPAFFNHLVRGRKSPGRKLAIKIRDRFGIPVEDW